MKVGVTIIEVTLRTPVAYEEIREINENLPPELFVGAGTVTSKKTLERALHARSDFIVITAITSSLVRSLQDCPVSVFPGVAKPGEALEIFEAGFSYFKFFPAESMGSVKALKSICDLLPERKYLPTGGINRNPATEYLALDNVFAVGGSWRTDKDAIVSGDWDKVEVSCRNALV